MGLQFLHDNTEASFLPRSSKEGYKRALMDINQPISRSMHKRRHQQPIKPGILHVVIISHCPMRHLVSQCRVVCIYT